MDFVDIIKKNFGKNILDIYIKNPKRIYIDIEPEYIRNATDFLFNQMKTRFATASAVDEKDYFEILYHFSLDKEGAFINLRVRLKDYKNPSIDTIGDLITGAKWIEREMHELMGIEFVSNEDMRHLVLSKDYKGKKFPLRKE